MDDQSSHRSVVVADRFAIAITGLSSARARFRFGKRDVDQLSLAPALLPLYWLNFRLLRWNKWRYASLTVAGNLF
jgi:hypothetical protein